MTFKIKYSKFNAGFTLIEVLLAVTITAIVGSIAYSSYSTSSAKTSRTEARNELNEIAQELQRCFTVYGRFDDPNNGCATWERLEGNKSIDTRTGLYEIRLQDDGNAANDATTFELRATPKANGKQVKDSECQMFSLRNTGAFAATNASNQDSPRCW